MTPSVTSHPQNGGLPDPGLRQTACGPTFGRPRAGRASLLAVFAVAAIGVVGVAIYSVFAYRQILARAAAPPADAAPASGQNAAKAPGAGRTVSVALDKAENRTPLVLLRADKDKEGGARPVVALGRPVGGKDKADTQGTIQSILERELIRQAILIAARDELGLPTRDELLDDDPPDNGKEKGKRDGELVEVAILFRRPSAMPWSVEVRVKKQRSSRNMTSAPTRMGDPSPSILRSGPRRCRGPSSPRPETAWCQGRAEQAPRRCSRSAGCRQAAGDLEHGRDLRCGARVARVDPRQRRVDSEAGGTGPRYAQLGVLTEYQWSPAHRVFKARALLYAQRLIARDAQSAQALQSRAFVRALIGRHDLALEDLDEATKLAQGEGAKNKAQPRRRRGCR